MFLNQVLITMLISIAIAIKIISVNLCHPDLSIELNKVNPINWYKDTKAVDAQIPMQLVHRHLAIILANLIKLVLVHHI